MSGRETYRLSGQPFHARDRLAARPQLCVNLASAIAQQQQSKTVRFAWQFATPSMQQVDTGEVEGDP